MLRTAIWMIQSIQRMSRKSFANVSWRRGNAMNEKEKRKRNCKTKRNETNIELNWMEVNEVVMRKCIHCILISTIIFISLKSISRLFNIYDTYSYGYSEHEHVCVFAHQSRSLSVDLCLFLLFVRYIFRTRERKKNENLIFIRINSPWIRESDQWKMVWKSKNISKSVLQNKTLRCTALHCKSQFWNQIVRSLAWHGLACWFPVHSNISRFILDSFSFFIFLFHIICINRVLFKWNCIIVVASE